MHNVMVLRNTLHTQSVSKNLLESGTHKTPIQIHLLDVLGVRT